jgi:hypothetical protein
MMVAEPTTTNVTRTAVRKSRRETRPRRGRLGGSRAAATARDDTSSSGFDNGVSLRGVALALALGVATTSTASDALAAVMYVGAGDEAFLEREYVDLKYAGVTDVVPGKMDGKRGVKVEYDAESDELRNVDAGVLATLRARANGRAV